MRFMIEAPPRSLYFVLLFYLYDTRWLSMAHLISLLAMSIIGCWRHFLFVLSRYLHGTLRLYVGSFNDTLLIKAITLRLEIGKQEIKEPGRISNTACSGGRTDAWTTQAIQGKVAHEEGGGLCIRLYKVDRVLLLNCIQS